MQLINYKATDPCPYSGMTPNVCFVHLDAFASTHQRIKTVW